MTVWPLRPPTCRPAEEKEGVRPLEREEGRVGRIKACTEEERRKAKVVMVRKRMVVVGLVVGDMFMSEGCRWWW